VRRIGWLLVLGLILGGCAAETVSGRSNVVDIGFLVLDATPTSAQVFIDGRPAGRASDFIGQVIYLRNGMHTVEVVAPGFRGFSHRFYMDPTFPSILRVVLRQESPRAQRGS
jgi:hypothetical protein